MTDEPNKAYKVLTPEEEAAAGLSSELTEADMKSANVNPSLCPICGGPDPCPTHLVNFVPPTPPGSTALAISDTVVDQRVRSNPPKFVESGPPADPPPVPWERLSPRVRAEMEAGRAALGTGGLSAQEAYTKAISAPAVVPVTTEPLFPPEIASIPAPISAKTLAEQEAGRQALRDRFGVQAAAVQQIAEGDAARLEAKAPPTGDEMNYVPREQPPP